MKEDPFGSPFDASCNELIDTTWIRPCSEASHGGAAGNRKKIAAPMKDVITTAVAQRMKCGRRSSQIRNSSVGGTKKCTLLNDPITQSKSRTWPVQNHDCTNSGGSEPRNSARSMSIIGVENRPRPSTSAFSHSAPPRANSYAIISTMNGTQSRRY